MLPRFGVFDGVGADDLRGLVDVTCELAAGILRIADGLDRNHISVVKNVDVNISGNRIEFCSETAGSASSEMFAAQKKADLLEKMTHYKTCFLTVNT